MMHVIFAHLTDSAMYREESVGLYDISFDSRGTWHRVEPTHFASLCVISTK